MALTQPQPRPQRKTAVRDGVTLDFGHIELTGSLVHDPGRELLELITDEGPERLATNLRGYGLVPAPGNVFVKDWSEHAGLTDSLVAQGLAKKVRQVAVGPFDSTAYEVELTI